MSITSKIFWKQLKKMGVQPNDKLLLAFSGGMDSVALFNLLLDAKITFAAAHVNYGLRGEDSIHDELFCKELCEKNNIEFFLYDAKEEMQSKAGISLQEAARNIRYLFFETLIASHNFNFILTAHHANDSVETFFVNLLRGSGSQGLKGIPEKNGIIIRPLLEFEKEEIEQYITEKQLQFREDTSNKKDDYLRNRIRHHVIPALAVADNSSISRIKETMKKLSAEAELLEYLMEEKFPSEIEKTNISLFTNFPPHLIPTVIFKRYQSIGINFSQAEDLAQIIKGISGKQFETPTHRLLLDREFILAQESKVSEKHQIKIYETNSQIPGYLVSIITRQEFETIKPGLKNKIQECAFFDIDKLSFPLTWRHIEIGDSMVPLGMKGRKKISDILIDNKKSRFEKENLHVLCSDNEIVWLENFRINDSSKITEQTCRVLCIIPEKL